MKKILCFIATVAVLLPLLACSISVTNKNDFSKQRLETKKIPNVAYFDKIESNGAFDVKFEQKNNNTITIKAPKRALDKIQVKVDKKTNTLVISFANNTKLTSHDLDDAEVLVSSPNLQSVSLYGAGDFECKSSLKADILKVNIDGAGDIDLNRLKCNKAYFTVNGAGDIDVDALTANYTDIQINGAGDADVDFVNSGDVNCSLYGAGNVELSGKVKTLNKNVQGVGNIETHKLTITK